MGTGDSLPPNEGPRKLRSQSDHPEEGRNFERTRLAIAEDRVRSSIFYGPPGSGKTTLARIVAASTGAAFEELSAVSASVTV